MADESQELWWRKTKALAVATLGGSGLLGFLLFAFGPALGGARFLGLPLDAFLAATGLPLALVAILFWFNRRQSEIDRRHFYAED